MTLNFNPTKPRLRITLNFNPAEPRSQPPLLRMPLTPRQEHHTEDGGHQDGYWQGPSWVFPLGIVLPVVVIGIVITILDCKYGCFFSKTRATSASRVHPFRGLVQASNVNSSTAITPNGSLASSDSTPPPTYSPPLTSSGTHGRLSIPLQVYVSRTRKPAALYQGDAAPITRGSVQSGHSGQARSALHHQDSADSLPRYEEAPSYTSFGATDLN
ncbi:hypothetical protein IAQ61_000718 [Plenodomus lingam]|nr:hypothetical protein IAQ61_000718 [Plenodomus lingam]